LAASGNEKNNELTSINSPESIRNFVFLGSYKVFFFIAKIASKNAVLTALSN